MKRSIKLVVIALLLLGGMLIYVKRLADEPVVVTINTPAAYESARGRTHRLPKQLWVALNRERAFRRFESTSAIPQVIRRAYALLSRRTSFSMAEPDSPWNSTDVGIEGLPDRRLRWGVVAGNLWIICFEFGGLGSGNAVMAFKVDGHAVDMIWRAYLPQPIESVSQLREVIKRGDAIDDPESYF